MTSLPLQTLKVSVLVVNDPYTELATFSDLEATPWGLSLGVDRLISRQTDRQTDRERERDR